MGRFTLTIVLGVGVWLLACSAGSAEERKKAKSGEAKPDAAAADQASAAERELAEREKAIQTWRAKLAGTQWELQLTPMGGQPGKPETDVLTFSRGAVGSEKLLKTGYPYSNNYALYSPTDQSIAWETMQLKEGSNEQDMVIWRGEVIGETMQGTLTKRRTDGKENRVEQFSFTGRKIAPAPESTPPAAQSEPPTAVPAPEVPAAAPERSGGS
jgi:hypothetical protein